jgi:hypothetical protein
MLLFTNITITLIVTTQWPSEMGVVISVLWMRKQAERGEAACPRSESWWVSVSGFESRCSHIPLPCISHGKWTFVSWWDHFPDPLWFWCPRALGSLEGMVKRHRTFSLALQEVPPRPLVLSSFLKASLSPNSNLDASLEFLDSASEYRLFAGASQQFVASRQWIRVLL